MYRKIGISPTHQVSPTAERRDSKSESSGRDSRCGSEGSTNRSCGAFGRICRNKESRTGLRVEPNVMIQLHIFLCRSKSEATIVHEFPCIPCLSVFQLIRPTSQDLSDSQRLTSRGFSLQDLSWRDPEGDPLSDFVGRSRILFVSSESVFFEFSLDSLLSFFHGHRRALKVMDLLPHSKTRQNSGCEFKSHRRRQRYSPRNDVRERTTFI